MIQRKRRDFKKGVRGLAPPIVLSGQPSALLALLTAGNRCNPYCDTVQNGFALGKSGTHDPQLDAKALLPTHTFPPCWNLRKSPKRPALPGAVSRDRRRSLAPTLSPALFSHPLSAASCLGYVSGLCRPVWACFFFSAFLLPVCSPSCVEGLAFSHPGLPLSWIRSQLAHTGPTGLVWGFAGVVPLPGSQNRTQALTGPSWVSPPFPGTLLLRKSRKLALQVVIHRIVNGKDRIKQRPVSRGSVPCPHRCRQGFDEILVL